MLSGGWGLTSPSTLPLPKATKRRGRWYAPKLAAAIAFSLGGALFGLWQNADTLGLHEPTEKIRNYFSSFLSNSPSSSETQRQIVSQSWNFVLDLPDDSWAQLHPGGHNALCTIAKLADPSMQVVGQFSVLGSMPGGQENIPEEFLRSFLDEILAQRISLAGMKPERRKINGISCLTFFREEPEGTFYFRDKPVAVSSWAILRNNVVYLAEFTATGEDISRKLPALAEDMMGRVRPLVPNFKIANGAYTVNEPEMLRRETGLSLPAPDKSWQPIVDHDTVFAALDRLRRTGFVRQEETSDPAATLGEDTARIIYGRGQPSVGYQTKDGDVVSIGVIHLPVALGASLASVADWTMQEWFSDATVDREGERSLTQGAATGMEFVGQLTRDASSAPYAIRILRRDEMLYLLAATSASGRLKRDQLADILDRAHITAPEVDTSSLNAAYTPPVCQDLHRRIILRLGSERESGNKSGEALSIYQYGHSCRLDSEMLLQYCQSMASLQQADKAVSLLRSHWRKIESEPRLLAAAAVFMARQKQPDVAAQMLLEALNQGGLQFGLISMEMVQDYFVALRDTHAHDEGLRVLDVINAKTPDHLWKLWEAHILYNSEDSRKRSLEIMEGLVAATRQNRNLPLKIFEFLKANKAHDMGLETANLVLRYDEQSVMAWFLKAICERELGQLEQSELTMRKAREYNPNLHEMDDFVYYLTDDEGGPVLSANARQIQPVPAPREIVQLMRSATAPPVTTDSHYSYLYRIHAMTADPGSPTRYTTRVSLRVHDAEGMEAFNILKIPYLPRVERLQMNELRVRNPDGSIAGSGDLAQSFITDETNAGSLTGMKIFNIPVPGLTPGSILEYTLTEESMGLRMGALTVRHIFAAEVPINLEAFYIHSPVTRIDFQHSRGTQPRKLDTGMLWVERNLPALIPEPNQPPLEQIAPVLWTGDANQTWGRVGSEYLGLIQHKLRADDNVKRLALEKTKHCKTQAEKVSQLAKFVRESLSYAAIEFGMRGLIPNTAAESIKNRYGDCKDHSVLLCQLLNAVGVPARLALVNATTSVQPDLPSLAAFNHMITAVPGINRGEWDFIDCTNKYMAPQPGVPPWMLADKFALLLGDAASPLSEDSSQMVKIPRWPADFERVEVQRQVSLRDPQTLAVHEAITLRGVSACDLRAKLASTGEKRDTASSLRTFFGMDRTRHILRKAEVEHLGDLDQPLIVRMDYDVRNACSYQGSLLVMHVPTLTEIRFLDPDAEGHLRATPFILESMFTLTSKTIIEAPAGLALAVPPQPGPITDKFSEWTSTANVRDGKGTISVDFQRKAGSFAAADYPAFQQQVLAAAHSVEEIRFIPASNKGPALATEVLTTQPKNP